MRIDSQRVGVSVDMTVRSDMFSNLESGLRQVADAKLGHVELWSERPFSVLERRIVSKMLGGLACTIHAPFVDFSLTSADRRTYDASRYRLLETMTLAHELGARAIALHPGPWPVYEEHAAVAHRFLARMERETAGFEIPVGVENLKPKTSGVQRNLITSQEDMRLLREIMPALQFTLDIGHAIQAGMDVSSTLNEFEQSICLLHLHDVDRTNHSHQTLGSTESGRLAVWAVAKHRGDFPVTLEMLREQDVSQSCDYLTIFGGLDDRSIDHQQDRVLAAAED